MPVQSDVSSTTTAHRDRRRSILLAGVSAAALFLSASEAMARPLGGSAPTASAAAVAAAQSAAEEAARAAMAANDSLRRATLAIQAQQAVQQAARDAARAAQQANVVPNGLRPGGLQVGSGVIGPNGSVNQNLWKGADLPTERADGDRVSVDIRQREQKAILSWDTFNVGARTDLRFDQQGNRNWVALNRVLGADARPSQILGSIKADGSVYVINQNGIIFGGTSQVNVGALVASTAKLSNEQFLNNGIYSRYENGTHYPSFTDAGGEVKVEPGALIETKPPAKNTTGGGFVLLLGAAVENAGRISSPQGQVMLGAGDDFLLRAGYGTAANQASTTRGHEIVPLLRADSLSGAVTNSGLIYSQQGDITLAGRTIVQDGALVSTTSVNTRGTIHLLNAVSDTNGSVTLGANSLTTILPELDSDATALNSQRDAFVTAVRPVGYDPQFDNLSKLPDRLDQSRIEIVTGGDVVFRGGSITQAQGGQVAVSAIGRVFTGSGATIDVSGTRGVLLPMSANNIEVNIQGNELRDSPVNRDQTYLKNADVWIDLRDLVLVPAGTGGYASDRYYTPGGLLEASGYLGNTAHKIGEWTAVGGTITLSARDVVAQQGAIFNISGGSVTYEGGYIRTSNFVGADGRTYNINNARADMQFTAVGGSFVRKHYIQGQVDDGLTEVWTSPFGKGRVSQRWEDGYTVGRDAGQLILSTPTSIFEGTILADIVKGERQTGKRPSGATDGYKLGQNTVAQAGTLALGDYGKPGQSPGAPLGFVTDVKFDDHVPSLANALSPNASVPEDRANTAWFDTRQLNSFGLGGLTVTTGGHVAIDAPLILAPGGQITAAAPVIDVNSTVTVRSGNVSFSNVVDVGTGTLPTIDGMLGVRLNPGAVIDTRGLWTNALLDRGNLSGLAFVDGGNVSLNSPQSVKLSAGSLIDASSGGAILINGKITGGKGGNITLIADVANGFDLLPGDPLVLEGTVRSYGMTKGGTLTISSGSAINISDLPLLADGLLPAGQATTTVLFLDSALVIPAGTQIPFTYSMTVRKALPGEALQMDLMPDFSRGVTVGANWQVPDSLAYVYDSNFTYYSPGTQVPAGTQLLGSAGDLTAGYVVPADAFPNGLAVTPTTVTYAAGSTAAKELSVPTGTRIPAGTVLAQTVAIKPPLNLDPGIFKSGFSNYDISSQVGVVVSKNTQVDVTMPVYRTTAASYTVPTGSDPATALEVWTPPLYQENVSTGQLTQRAGGSLKLTTDPNTASGSGILIDTGAALRVDPGQSVSIASTGQVTVDGMISAPGGAITIDLTLQSQTGIPGQSIWIGDNAVLDVAGRSVTAVDRQGRPYGVVSDGGSIAIGVRFDSNGQVDNNGFVVVRPGAVLDASGASAVIAPYGAVGGAPTAVASNGGSIALASRHGIFLDGTVRAATGGAGASGGTLSLLLGEKPAGADWDPSDVQLVPRRLIITQDYVPSGMRADLKPGEADPTLGYGVARISAKQVEAGGFDSLSLWSSTAFVFDGPVSLNLGRSIVFDRGVLTSSDTASSVALTAPYVLLRGYAFTTGLPGSSFSISSPSSQATTAKLTVSADLIDIQNYVQFGASGKIESNSGAQVLYDMAGFRDIDLTSRGDIRFVRNTAQTSTFPSGTRTTLRTPGNLTLTAAQLYPTTGAQAEVYAAFDPSLPDARLSIKRIDDALPQTPFSAFGSLSLYATVIDQGGVIRAPLGDIVLGADSNSFGTIRPCGQLPYPEQSGGNGDDGEVVSRG
ncbi:filamentous hemagglutinin N-terminal domain-containing protein, partial [Bradyrhizobium sp. 31Argb]|uniref:two-partner secretion domain-containing protein n=1 Tax=Bradyrhizobium sp. 31Argb TaxID=3141247 RepID=UPI00374A867C